MKYLVLITQMILQLTANEEDIKLKKELNNLLHEINDGCKIKRLDVISGYSHVKNIMIDFGEIKNGFLNCHGLTFSFMDRVCFSLSIPSITSIRFDKTINTYIINSSEIYFKIKMFD